MTYSSRTSMMSCGVGTPSRDLTIEDLFSSRMISMQSSTHSSQMNTVGPAISLRTSCWLLPQNEQYRVFLESPPLNLVMPTPLRGPAPGATCPVPSNRHHKEPRRATHRTQGRRRDRKTVVEGKRVSVRVDL